jgi:hypothetical protein
MATLNERRQEVNLSLVHMTNHDNFRLYWPSLGVIKMSVKSSSFGVTYLSGEDAEKFRNQVSYGRPSEKAVAALKRGEAMLRGMDSKGRVIIKLKGKTKS